MALIGLGVAAAAAASKKPKVAAPITAPAPTMLGGPLSAVPRATTALGSPTPPDTTLAAQQSALAALNAANRQRMKATGANNLYLGTPGTSTPPAKLQQRTLLGSY